MIFLIIYFSIGLAVALMQLKHVLFWEHDMRVWEMILGFLGCATLWPIVLFNFFKQ